MSTLYTISIFLYGLGIRIASLFHPKAKQWVKGRKGVFRRLDQALKEDEGSWKGNVWFHCASLGEFEQGRPVIESFRELYPEYRIILTFYSPSGHEVRKSYPIAEGIFYMPLDLPLNARRWVARLKPKLVFFIKYEYWFNFLNQLNRQNIPVFIISAIFHPNQPFFKPYGSWFRKQLKQISWFFLQSEDSKTLVETLGIKNFTITGDTRFDRVWNIRERPNEFPLINRFAGNAKIFLGGSTWEPDEKLILGLIRQNRPGLKFIIAPHEVHASRIEELEVSLQLAVGSLPLAQGSELRTQGKDPQGSGIRHPASGITDHESSVIRYSSLNSQHAVNARVLIIDSIGILAHLYQYAHLTLIGGGFGVGIHNILEAAVFGNPVMFGPNFRKFTEARELIRLGGAFPVANEGELAGITKRLLENEEEYSRISSICRTYVENGRGATRRILQGIQTIGFIAPPGKKF